MGAGIERGDTEQATIAVGRNLMRTFLFLGMFFLFWITTNPFPDLGVAINTVAPPSDTLYQAVMLMLSTMLLFFGLKHPLKRMILQPAGLLSAIFIWYIIVSLLSLHPDVAVKRAILGALVCMNASIFLLLPKSEQHFAGLLSAATLVILGVAYWGVMVWPQYAIHNMGDFAERELAGDWRGQFSHKNTAAGVMVISVFFGLYAWSSQLRLRAVVIVLLSTYFLLKTGGKTSSAALPATLVLAALFERFKSLRFLIVLGGIIAINFVTVGAAFLEPVREFLASVGIDPTFTTRTDIWRLAINAVARQPFTGYGFDVFWGSPELVYGGGQIENNAIHAGAAHNAYVDMLVSAGIPGLILVFIWLLILPIIYIKRAEEREGNPHLTRLYMRIWIYVIFASCTDSLFFQNRNPVWFALLIAVFGLRFQAKSDMIKSAVPRTVRGGLAPQPT